MVMLCDDLVIDTILPLTYDRFERVQEKIRKSQKFILSREFAMAADGLVDNAVELQKVAPFCLLPFPLTWIECLHDDRPHWNPSLGYGARPVDRERHQREPHRVGFLLEQRGDFAGQWKVTLFWQMKGQASDPEFTSRNNGSVAAMLVDIRNDDGDKPLVAMTEVTFAEFGQKLISALMDEAPDVASRLAQYAIDDWGGEFRYVLAVLGLLNTRNVATTEPVNYTRQNAKRARRGGRQLFSYNLLKVRPNIIPARSRKGSGELSNHTLRMHFVRGHFKRRASGVFWWNTFVRGQIKHGFASKDYELTT
jgi:hypothetical protein